MRSCETFWMRSERSAKRRWTSTRRRSRSSRESPSRSISAIAETMSGTTNISGSEGLSSAQPRSVSEASRIFSSMTKKSSSRNIRASSLCISVSIMLSTSSWIRRMAGSSIMRMNSLFFGMPW